MSERVALTVRLPKEFHKALKVWAVENETDLQTTIETAVQGFLGGKSQHSAGCPLEGATPAETKEAKLLLELLRNGSSGSVRAVQALLRSWKE